MDVETITKGIGAVTATFALIGGGYTLTDKLGLLDRDILRWEPAMFEISDGPANEPFRVVVAREKLRDDCTVEDFILDVRSSDLIVHQATPSITKFMGPANDRVDTFAYTFTLSAPDIVAPGEATLIAYIHYGCPEGKKVVQYPDHANLRFNIER